MAQTGLSAKAILTLKGASFSRPIDVFNVLEYQIDTALDTDADQFSISVGDFGNDLIVSLARDVEVEVNIFVVGQSAIAPLHRGFSDEIGLDHESRLVINGRDISAVATDSQVSPDKWNNMSPAQIISKQARALKIGDRLNINNSKPFKLISTDGSESYWEFWYRLMRKRSKWLWTLADGTIIGNDLNYDSDPIYFFGEPAGDRSSRWVKVEAAQWKKSTSSRIGEVFVFGHRGDKPFIGKAIDDTIAHWIKKPTKILTDPHAHTQALADQTAKEEIFDSKVGALEWQLTIADPGFIVEQNTMAEVNLPSIGLKGKFFVVGTQTFGGTEGLYQVVRLRERNFAISKRTPPDPEPPESPTGTAASGIGYPGTDLGTNVRWAECFSRAAFNHAGPWDFKLFLAALIAICFCGEGGRNVREGGSTEWYQPPEILTDPKGWAKFQDLFGNEVGAPGNTFGREAGVGPMQLTDLSYKQAADRLKNPNVVDQYVGGRWWPCSNIEEAAIVLREKLQATGAERAGGQQTTTKPEDSLIWLGVKAYNGSGPLADAYLTKVKDCAIQQYLPMIEAGLQAAKDDAKNSVTVPAQLHCVNAPTRNYYNRVKTGPTDGIVALHDWLAGQGFRAGDPDPYAIDYTGHAGGPSSNTPGGTSYHYSGQAMDIGDGSGGEDGSYGPASAARLLVPTWNALWPLRNNLVQLIWAPNPIVVPEAPGAGGGYFCAISGGFSDHHKHIHVAFAGSAAQFNKLVSENVPKK